LLSNTALREDIHSEKVILGFVSKIGDLKSLEMLYILTYADVNAVSSHVYTSFNADLMHELYKNASLMIDKKELVGEAVKRKRREKNLELNPRFAALPQALQKKILTIESNLFFIKFKSDEILDIVTMIHPDRDFSVSVENDKRFIIHLITRKPFNLGWFLSQFVHIDLVSMDIFRLFDRAKYFRMEFHDRAEEGIDTLPELIEAAFDMERKIDYPKPIIKKNEITVDCDHSLTYAKMMLRTKNQKGLMASVIEVFDEMNADIATAKISTVKNIATDLFLIEKSAHFCDNYKKIVAMLTK
jgi:[protein-PII] uridylyltransferase